MTGRPPAPPESRFFGRVNEVGECWIWTGGTAHGYGHFWDGHGNVKAHRWAYEFLVGPIPDGLQLDHLCRNRACVNPWHLEPVTASINIRRSRKDLCANGHPLLGDPSGRRCPICRSEVHRRYRLRKKGVAA